MPSAVRRSTLTFASLVLGLALLPGCGVLEDNGTHLAYALERGASDLLASTQAEVVVRYETLDGPAEPYYVEITPSGSADSGHWSSYLVVSGKTSGGTSYHNRFVFVPQRLYLKKDQGGPTEVVLRREAGRIEVVGLR